MTSQEILDKFIKFYEARGHKQIPNVSLIPENDPTLLYVNSGMFPLVPYFTGQPHPMGKRLVNVQRALRFNEDLDNVGTTNRHTTAFHMMGNWSLGDYFKTEQLPWVYEFFIEELKLDPKKLFASVFVGDEFAPKDNESIEILKGIFLKYGINAKENEKIFAYGRSDNWWQRGEAVGELGGPDSETFYYIGQGDPAGKSPAESQDDFLEIGNSVFMQYKKTHSGWEPLSQKNVDFGGGLERIALVVQEKKDIFETDNFWPIITAVQEISDKSYFSDFSIKKTMRVLADHMRSATFLAMDGVIPSNKDQGYILRRLLRRMIRAGRQLGLEKDISVRLVPVMINMFSWLYPALPSKKDEITETFSAEEKRFFKTLEKGNRSFQKILPRVLEMSAGELGKSAFDLYQSVGYPQEIFLEDLKVTGVDVKAEEFKAQFNKVFEDHQKESRSGAEQKFKGGLADQSETTIKYHTVTHLLHHALRYVLGDQVHQQGSNITGERLRFDFNYETKLAEERIKRVEDIVNELIDQKLPVNFKMFSKEEAEKTGALHFFGEKYGDAVKVYYVGNSIENAISKEFCGGPHVKSTGDLLHVKIYKQEKMGEGKMRIYAKFE